MKNLQYKIIKHLSFFLILLSTTIYSQIRPSVFLGIGLPKIPVTSVSRTSPFSVTGGLLASVPVFRRIIIQVHGNGLYSFDLGSAISQSKKFKFNLLWTGIDLGYSLRYSPMNRSSVILGISEYSLSQTWEDMSDNLNTAGICLGLSNIKSGLHANTIFEIKWHLLFHPEPMPQVLTITFGYVF
ncbi:hypothetical protein DRQ07_02290 [candidate division KSB1 bacterium]|nr:MAG: hypothetical protein DRQ07_02290 [candidate division KSB1 bacterium]